MDTQLRHLRYPRDGYRQAPGRRAPRHQAAGQLPAPCPRAEPADLAGGSLTLASAPPRTCDRVFPATPSQVRQARKFLAAALDGCPVTDDAVLCLSELASNSVLHSNSKKAGGTFTVRAEVHDGDYLWLEVEDNGGPWEQRTHRDGRAHGLGIVRDLATDSGRDGDPVTGWVMWARLDWPAPPS
jgi:serine/threonine-protein kinase RsbW